MGWLLNDRDEAFGRISVGLRSATSKEGAGFSGNIDPRVNMRKRLLSRTD